MMGATPVPPTMTNDVVRWIGFITIAYLAGSIPFGLLLGRLRGVNIRQHGSGNIGATNVGRVLGIRFGAVCFSLDFAKGAIPVAIAGASMRALGERPVTSTLVTWWIAVAASAVVGHMYPIWLRFKGGKGMATGFGALAAMWPVVTIAAGSALLLWILSVRISRYVGISSCIAAASMPIMVALGATRFAEADATIAASIRPYLPAIITSAALAVVVTWRHRGNIRRTLTGTEPKSKLFFGGRRSPNP